MQGVSTENPHLTLREGSISTLTNRYKSPTPINLDLRLEQRITTAERKGYRSMKLTYYKKELEPI